MTSPHEALGGTGAVERASGECCGICGLHFGIHPRYKSLDALETAVAKNDGCHPWVAPSTVAIVRAQVDEDVRRLLEENAHLRTALEAIDNYERPFHSPSAEEWAEYKACPECTRRRENQFHPSNHCDAHYRSLVMEYERRNDDEKRYHTAYNMRAIARAALEPFKGSTVEEAED